MTTEVRIEETPVLLAPEPEPDAAAVEIARIEAEARVTINDTDAAVRLAEIEARHSEELNTWQSRATTAEERVSALTLELSNSRSLNLQAQETASNLTEAIVEAVVETTITTPPSTPESETPMEVGDGSAELVEVEAPAEVAAEQEAVAPAAKRRRVIV